MHTTEFFNTDSQTLETLRQLNSFGLHQLSILGEANKFLVLQKDTLLANTHDHVSDRIVSFIVLFPDSNVMATTFQTNNSTFDAAIFCFLAHVYLECYVGGLNRSYKTG